MTRVVRNSIGVKPERWHIPTEIERKFLVTGSVRRQVNAVRYSQGYLNRDKERIVRVRLAGEKALLTIKGLTEGASRAEFEYEIPVMHAEQLLRLCDGPILQKVRHIVEYNGLIWEIDEFLGENEGLVVAEVELEREDQFFERAGWLGQEVTEDPRYFNSNLCTNPYCKWGERQEAFGFFLYEGRERCICKASNTSIGIGSLSDSITWLWQKLAKLSLGNIILIVSVFLL